MSPDVVARAKAALEGVTEGPWEMRDSFVYPLSISARLGGIRPGDAEFIAAARSLVPELVAEVERLQAALHRVREMATSYTPSPDLVEAIVEELDR